MTVLGKTCQRWDSQQPHTHPYNQDSYFPDNSLAGAANYCRNPHGGCGGLWCYTTDPGTAVERCEVPRCRK